MFLRVCGFIACFVVLFLASCSPDKTPERQEVPGKSADLDGERASKARGQDQDMEGKNDASDIVVAIRQALSKKDKQWPYYAEYESSFARNLQLAGHAAKRRIIAEGRDSLYSEMVAEAWTSRVLIKKNEFYWEYVDTQQGSCLFQGSVDLAKSTPDRCLRDHEFFFNSYSECDTAMVSAIEQLLKGARVLARKKQDSAMLLTMATKSHDEVTVSLGPSEIIVKHKPRGGLAQAGTLFRYSYHTGIPGWRPDPRAELLAKFAKGSDAKVHALAGDFTMDSALEKAFPDQNKNVSVTFQKAREHAQKYGFLFPDKGKIRSAEIFNDQLSLQIKGDSRSYWISQFASDSPIPESWVKRRRTVKGFTVLDVLDPGTESKQLYYSKGKHIVLASDLKGKAVDFKDPELDRLIVSLEPVRP